MHNETIHFREMVEILWYQRLLDKRNAPKYRINTSVLIWLRRQDSNLRPPGYEHLIPVRKRPRKRSKSRTSSPPAPTTRRPRIQSKDLQSCQHYPLPIPFSTVFTTEPQQHTEPSPVRLSAEKTAFQKSLQPLSHQRKIRKGLLQ